jgi:hypothetical protein
MSLYFIFSPQMASRSNGDGTPSLSPEPQNTAFQLHQLDMSTRLNSMETYNHSNKPEITQQSIMFN